jgi:cytochrome P450
MDAPAGHDSTDLLSPELTHSPHAYFAKLREESPIHWNARHKGWIISRYQDVSNGFRDSRLLSNRIRPYREKLPADQRETIGHALGILESWMVFQDDPEHRRLRGIVHKAFTPQIVASLQDAIRDLAREQVRKVMDRLTREPDRPVDLLNEMAYEIPGPIICQMLGVPEADRLRFVDWSEQISSVIGGFVDDEDRNARTHAAVTALEQYLTDIIERTPPGDSNLMGRLVDAEADGQRLSRHEVIATGILVLFGGNRTTSCMIANGLRALMLHPDQQALLAGNPPMLGPAVEEIMRWEAHTKVTVRISGEDFEWEGQPVRKGQRVFLSPLSANRDDAMFVDPTRFDITRSNANRHLSFGTGIHLCLGMSLARLELRIVFEEMLKVMPDLELVQPDSEWLPTLINRVQKHLLVRRRTH